MNERHAPTDEALAVIGSLNEPVRRNLYRYVVSRPGEVGRDEAAEAVGVQRSLAAFHLDKLVEAGLLEVTYRRLSGRSGPGAGRPAKLYRRSSAEHRVSLPPRQYDLAAALLAEAVEEGGGGRMRRSVLDAARRYGQRLGEEARSALGPKSGRKRRLAALSDALERHGYEPQPDGACLRLGNCPFHSLAEGHRELVCGMNLALLGGVVEGVGGGLDLEARPDPTPGPCCVTLAPVEGRGRSDASPAVV